MVARDDYLFQLPRCSSYASVFNQSINAELFDGNGPCSISACRHMYLKNANFVELLINEKSTRTCTNSTSKTRASYLKLRSRAA